MKTIGLVVLSLVFFSCTGAQKTTNEIKSTEVVQSNTKNVNVSEFQKLLTQEGILLDVRTSGEYEQGHIENATNIDVLGADFSAKINELDKSKPVYVYCKSGGRSTRAMNQMKELGFTEIYNLQGGFSDWAAQGLPFVK